MCEKQCKRCGDTKDAALFGRDKSKADGLTYACKACTSAYKLKYDQSHKRRTVSPKRESTAMTREAKLEQNRVWRANNPEKVRAIYSDYKKKNKHVINAIVSARRAANLQAMPTWADKNRIRKLYEIAQRITKVTGIKHQVDHIVPLISNVVCGLHVPANLRVLAADANREKSNQFYVV